MNTKYIIFLPAMAALCALLILSGCKTTSLDSSSYPPNSIGGNSQIPEEIFVDFYGEEVTKAFIGRPYDVYVRFRANTDRDDILQIKRALYKYPEEIDLNRIQKFPEGLKNKYKAAGSRIKPSLKVHVVCFEKNMFPMEAIVMVEPEGIATPESSVYDRWIKVIQYTRPLLKQTRTED
ncbi:hypothetical protein G0Q06_05235 [Puniceicoccales bacterium CK1056]|uniref:Lipoprotein n=1 Tax=Oceanipulchritudo coccoides TaxID=2706888 RepID=A0A6B2M1A4_9BACT|nr:hypothetical protein [Oceanipulchritudo coccoides]NDV61847.1 hypothetical protein [Oceanipulchritudo coccoides]